MKKIISIPVNFLNYNPVSGKKKKKHTKEKMTASDYDYLFKVIIIGDPNIGKTSLLLRFADDKFNDKNVQLLVLILSVLY